jgi:sugar/nucleoside kinase (ribokinase family)
MATSPIASLRADAGYRQLFGVGGIGTGMFFRLEGDRPLGRNESRAARLLDARDYCKLHIISHYVAALMGAGSRDSGFHVVPIGKVGADEPGLRIIEELRRNGVDVSHIQAVEGRITLFSVCYLFPDGAGGNITSSSSAAATLDPADIDAYAFLLAAGGSSSIALAVPEVPLETRDRLLEIATVHGALRVASFTSSEIQPALDRGIFSRVDLLALNEDEAGVLAGSSFDADEPEPFLANCARRLCSIQPEIRIVISAGRRGAFGFEGGLWDHRPAPTIRDAHTAGAGDALLAGVVSGLAAGLPFIGPGCPGTSRPVSSSLDLGVLLAAYSVTSPHTIHPDASLATLMDFAGEARLDCSPLASYIRPGVLA